VRCLIIDDDESPRVLMERLVTRAGHRVTGCASPMAGIEAVTMQPFDVAIVDMEMPGMDGAALIGELRRVVPEIRVLVVSGYGDRNHVMAAIEAGADGYILKDELADSLADSLQEVRAGHTPLSPRVARLMLARLRQTMGTKSVGTGPHPIVKDTTPITRDTLPLGKLKKPD
jgi:DNA-binding NarL/FixJ family response regulator